MAPVHLRLRNTDERYGYICPLCAGPKTLQASECVSCFREGQRPEEYWIRRTCECGRLKNPKAIRCHPCAVQMRNAA